MLTRIESYAGILLASTNLIDHLDPSSLRRFDLKLHFDYLRPDQAQQLLTAHCRNLGIAKPTTCELEAITCVVIGGTLLSGGVGGVVGTFAGILTFGTLQAAIVFDGRLSVSWTRIVMGALLLAYVLLQRLLVARR